MNKKYDYLIIGSGIIGLAIAKILKEKEPDALIGIIEKESDIAGHASSRNSGVLHAGFYYTANSLKAKFTVEGNNAIRQYCSEKGISINTCGKLVIAQNDYEVKQLFELAHRGKNNGSNVEIIDEAQACEIEPNVNTYQKALYSPDTASVNPKEVCQSIKNDLLELDIEFHFETKYCAKIREGIMTDQGEMKAKKIINCAGLYADKIAQDFNFGGKYTIIPFKGIYLKYTKNKTDIKVNIYPVPNLKNPFLGVHFTKTVTGDIKIGPTAIPAFWRENYQLFSNFKFLEMPEIVYQEAKLFFSNAFGFRDLAIEEFKKYKKSYLVSLARSMVKDIDEAGFTEFTAPGIRAQLLDKRTSNLVQDFVIEGDHNSTHILNAVSPAFTCSFPFAKYVCEKYI